MSEETPIDQIPIESDGTADIFRVRDSSTGKDFALRLGTDEQLQRLQSDLFAQFQGYKSQLEDIMMKMANALAGSNVISFEIDRRARVNPEKLNGAQA